MNASRTLYIVDDNRDFLESTCFWLGGDDDLEVIACDDPARALDTLAARDRRRPACLMLDIRMPGLTGLQLHDRLREHAADLPVIYMSGHADVPLAVQAMQKGAVTLLEKPFDDVQLDQALRQAFARAAGDAARVATDVSAAGTSATDVPGPHAAPAGARPLAGSSTDSSTGSPAARTPDVAAAARARFAERHAKLSPRERQVLELAIQGIYNKNIADRIGLSIKTVELYRARGMAKMQARSIAELTRMMVTAQVH